MTEIDHVYANTFEVLENENTIQSNNFNILIDKRNGCRTYFCTVDILNPSLLIQLKHVIRCLLRVEDIVFDPPDVYFISLF